MSQSYQYPPESASGKTSQPQNAPAGFVAGGNAQHAASENSYATSDGANVTNFPADAAYPGTFNTNDPNNARQQDPQDGWIPGFASMDPHARREALNRHLQTPEFTYEGIVRTLLQQQNQPLTEAQKRALAERAMEESRRRMEQLARLSNGQGGFQPRQF